MMTMTPEAEAVAPTALDAEHLRRARMARRDFLVAIEQHRPALFGYCRRLTGNVWDAEDLVQETLTRAFARAAETHVGIDNPRAWLVRVATNAYLDQTRRIQPVPLGDTDVPAAESATDPGEVRDAMEELVTVLPPQERAVVVLKDVFDYPLSDIAGMVGTTTGAVKSALHRARGKLAEPRPLRRHPIPDRRVLEAAAAAFTAYDVEALVDLFLADGVMHIVGMVHETGAEQMRNGSLEHTFNQERDVRYRAEVREFQGEPLVAIFSEAADGGEPRGLAEVWRCVTEGDRLRSACDYFFCPEVVAEVARAWGVPTVLHGYRYH